MIETHLRASQEAQRAGDFDGMLDAARRACESPELNLQARFRLLECLIYCGKVDEVRADLAELEELAKSDHRLLAHVAEMYTHCADHHGALRCYQRAVALWPESSEYHFAVSAALIATGDLEAAETHLDQAISLNPRDFDAYRNRATLKKQTKDSNHIDELESLHAAGVETPSGQAQICYALAKEYEDLGEDETSFTWLQRGADARKSVLQYKVEEDEAVVERLIEAFDKELLQREDASCSDAGPLFVMGLPRSGTTLVDRILSSHSQVDSLGEINNFVFALMHTVGQSADKLTLIDLSTKIDFSLLGRRYVDGTRSFGVDGPYLIDKTPLNYLYVGLIRKALPNAKIVHVERNPMDSVYGMYRTLFRAGYPFSYDFDDLGRYYLAYRRLIDHWRDVCGDAVHWLRYEDLVQEQEAESRRLIDYCGLDWEPECLEFHRNRSAVMTASSAQVRRPVYREAMGRWRRYEKQLAPLREFLEENGIAVDDA
jgi:tetratricopeptide (TPR) repeat protein